ncbi:MAG: outer membrane lipoprotein-sorting protein [Mariprofundaceae bacterium]|nr:outer membrane lipoprotein-sorting protein [Mariprofundaceae bacterium]
MKKIILSLLLLITPLAWAEDASQIMEEAHLANYYAADDAKAHVSMQIINSDGATREREFTILRRDVEDGGDQWFYVFFKKPSDVRGMSFLVNKHPHADDDRWLFIPAIKMIKRIAASDARSAFVGSDYTYEDISGRHPSSDSAEMMTEESIHERNTWKIKNTPKTPEKDYSYRYTWVDQQTKLILKEVYFDAANTEVRIFTNDEMKEVNGHWVGIAGTMKNIELNHTTKVRFSKVELNLGIPENIFSERSLKSAPRKWVR